MKTLVETLKLSAEFLEARGVGRGRRQAEELLAQILRVKRIDLYLQHDRPLEEKELGLLRNQLKRLVKGEPVQYVVGHVDFYHCHFEIGPAVLIPRSETEQLVDLIVRRLKGRDLKGKVLWDLCTGSGCIGVSLKKALPDLQVILSDLSPQALEIAARNSKANGVKVEMRQGDLLAPFELEKADFIVSNPPYISAKEYLTLDRTVAAFEPKIALVAGESGLEFYERLARELPSRLTTGAEVFFEIGASQEEDLKSIFNNPVWVKKEFLSDWSGRPRFFCLKSNEIL